MEAASVTEHKLPIWLADRCLQDLNTTRDWMNTPFLYPRNTNTSRPPTEDETWLIATNGFSLIALKMPLEDHPHETYTIYLKPLNMPYVTSFIDDIFKEEKPQSIDINKLKSQLTVLTSTDQACNICSSTGSVTCDACDGSTEVPCGRCNGYGSKPCVTCQKPDACEPCDGLGVVECIKCADGKVSCSCVDADNEILVQIGSTRFSAQRLKDTLVNMHGECSVGITKSSVVFQNDKWLACLAGVNSEKEPLYINLSEL
jgi:hypothetical protein